MVEAEYRHFNGSVLRANIIDDHIVFSRQAVDDVVSVFSLAKRQTKAETDYSVLLARELRRPKSKVDADGYLDVRPLPHCEIPYTMYARKKRNPADFYDVTCLEFHPSGLYTFCGTAQGVIFIVQVEDSLLVMSRRVHWRDQGEHSNMTYRVSFEEVECGSRYIDESEDKTATHGPCVRRALCESLTSATSIVEDMFLKDLLHRVLLLAAFGKYQVQVEASLFHYSDNARGSSTKKVMQMSEPDTGRLANFALFIGNTAQGPMNFFYLYTDALHYLVRRHFQPAVDSFFQMVDNLQSDEREDVVKMSNLVDLSIRVLSLCGKYIRPLIDSCQRASQSCLKSLNFDEKSSRAMKELHETVSFATLKLCMAYHAFERAFSEIGRVLMIDQKHKRVNCSDGNGESRLAEFRAPPADFSHISRVRLLACKFVFDVVTLADKILSEFLQDYQILQGSIKDRDAGFWISAMSEDV